MKQKFLNCFFLVIIIFSNFNISNSNPQHQLFNFNITSNSTLQSTVKSSVHVLLPVILSFIAAAISSAGGIGGGGLFIPILTIVAALDLRTASTYSAFMVTGGSIANVACHMLRGKKQLIDYDIALLSEPCMLLGVSIGVICNLILPEWLITVIFVIFLGFCTFKTCKSGILFWKLESEGLRMEMENEIEEDDSVDDESTKVPLLRTELSEGKMGIPWMKIGMLLLIWVSFFLFNLLRGNRYGQGIINIKPCGTGYWTISSIQIPLAIVFTTLILYIRKKPKRHQENKGPTCSNSSQKAIFPIMALLAGVLGGVFGIGGGMLISPLLLQIGIEPKVTAATCSFMVLFSSSMSAVQYLLLGMDHLSGALAYAAICFIGSLVGLTLVQQAIMKHGRASLIVFSVGTVMALSTVLITSFGAVDVLNDYMSGKSMGFKRPC